MNARNRIPKSLEHTTRNLEPKASRNCKYLVPTPRPERIRIALQKSQTYFELAQMKGRVEAYRDPVKVPPRPCGSSLAHPLRRFTEHFLLWPSPVAGPQAAASQRFSKSPPLDWDLIRGILGAKNSPKNCQVWGNCELAPASCTINFQDLEIHESVHDKLMQVKSDHESVTFKLIKDNQEIFHDKVAMVHASFPLRLEKIH